MGRFSPILLLCAFLVLSGCDYGVNVDKTSDGAIRITMQPKDGTTSSTGADEAGTGAADETAETSEEGATDEDAESGEDVPDLPEEDGSEGDAGQSEPEPAEPEESPEPEDEAVAFVYFGSPG